MLAVVACFSFTGVAQAGTLFYLGGHGGTDEPYVFNKDGITLTATATAEDHHGNSEHAEPHQNLYGLGVKNSGNWWHDGEDFHGDDKNIDSYGLIDTLWLDFSETVTLEWAKFSDVPSGISVMFGGKPEDANFSDGDDNDLGSVELVGGFLDHFGTVDFSDEGLTLTGKTFGITPGKKDSFRLKKVKVSTAVVPSPAAAGAGLALLGLAAMRRQRRRTTA